MARAAQVVQTVYVALLAICAGVRARGVDLEDLLRGSGHPISSDDTVLAQIPAFVLEHAPLVHLYSGERFWPCDIERHLEHITPHLNYTPLQPRDSHPTPEDLDDLNRWEGGAHVYLQSDDDVESAPAWLTGEENIPSDGRASRDGPQRPMSTIRRAGYSKAPAVLLVIDKGDGVVDAFWFFFYSFNLGNVVLNVRFGNHVGDWEHTMVRFVDGKPTTVFLSEHFFGQAYKYNAVEKRGKRVCPSLCSLCCDYPLTPVKPVVYSAEGSHAMYATPGTHSYILPLGFLHDETDAGPLWDPSLNVHAYTYAPTSTREPPTSALLPATPAAPTGWFRFRGHWGDRIYPLTDARQYTVAGNYHYVSGPTGPRFKDLDRVTVCQGHGECNIRDHLDGERDVRFWPPKPFEVGNGDELLE